MSQYDDLDAAILHNLDKYGHATLCFVSGGAVRDEASRIGEATGRVSWRIIDGRLQALRKRGVIKYDRKHGWSKT